MAIEDATGIGVHDEDRMIPSIEENRVRGFRPYPIQAEQLFAKFFGRLSEKLIERAPVVLVEEGDERLEPRGFLAEITGWTNQALESTERHFPNSFDTQYLRRTQVF